MEREIEIRKVLQPRCENVQHEPEEWDSDYDNLYEEYQELANCMNMIVLHFAHNGSRPQLPILCDGCAF